jgi:hypothetical protein
VEAALGAASCSVRVVSAAASARGGVARRAPVR